MMYTWLDGKCYATSSNEEMQSPCISGKYCFVDLSQRDFLSQTMYIHKLINLLYYLLFLLFVVCVGFSLGGVSSVEQTTANTVNELPLN